MNENIPAANRRFIWFIFIYLILITLFIAYQHH